MDEIVAAGAQKVRGLQPVGFLAHADHVHAVFAVKQPDVGEQLKPAHIGKRHIGKNDVDAALTVEERQRFLAALRPQDRKLLRAQGRTDAALVGRIGIDHQNPGGGIRQNAVHGLDQRDDGIEVVLGDLGQDVA